jgi:hypothetical protein
LIIIGAASLAVILMAAFAIVVATRDRPNPAGSTSAQGKRPIQLRALLHITPRPSDAVTAYLHALAAGDARPLPCPTRPIQRPKDPY